MTEHDENLEVERRRVALYEALRWAWTVQLQAKRLTAIQDELRAEALSEVRQDFTQERAERFYQLDAEAHFLINAGDMLRATLPRVGRKLPEGLAHDINRLRDFFEHPDKKTKGTRAGRSAYERFKESRPLDEPTDHRFGSQGTFLGGIEISGLTNLASEVYRDLQELQKTD